MYLSPCALVFITVCVSEAQRGREGLEGVTPEQSGETSVTPFLQNRKITKVVNKRYLMCSQPGDFLNTFVSMDVIFVVKWLCTTS